MLTSHLFVSRHLFAHVVRVAVLQLLLFDDRRRTNRRKVVDDDVIAWQTSANVRRLLHNCTMEQKLYTSKLTT